MTTSYTESKKGSAIKRETSLVCKERVRKHEKYRIKKDRNTRDKPRELGERVRKRDKSRVKGDRNTRDKSRE